MLKRVGRVPEALLGLTLLAKLLLRDHLLQR